MLFRRSSYNRRKYLHAGSSINAGNAESAAGYLDSPSPDILKESSKIPLPEEFKDDLSPELDTRKYNNSFNMPNIFKLIKKNIAIDDIILLGLIFLLLDENTEDELLLILLIYIFLTGRK